MLCPSLLAAFSTEPLSVCTDSGVALRRIHGKRRASPLAGTGGHACVPFSQSVLSALLHLEMLFSCEDFFGLAVEVIRGGKLWVVEISPPLLISLKSSDARQRLGQCAIGIASRKSNSHRCTQMKPTLKCGGLLPFQSGSICGNGFD